MLFTERRALQLEQGCPDWLRFGVLALTPIQAGDAVHAFQRVRIAFPEDLTSSLQGGDEQRLGLRELALKHVQHAQPAGRRQGLWVPFTEGLTAGGKCLREKMFRLV